MDEIQDELQDSLNPDESGELNTTDEEVTGEETSSSPQLEEIADVAREIEKLKATNAKLYARAKKAEEALKGRNNSTNANIQSDDALWKQKIEFLLKHKDFDEEQIDYLTAFAKGKGITLEEAFKDALVKKAIEADQKEKRIANATPQGSSKSPQFQNLQQQINEASDRETHKKLWEQFSQGISKGVESE